MRLRTSTGTDSTLTRPLSFHPSLGKGCNDPGALYLNESLHIADAERNCCRLQVLTAESMHMLWHAHEAEASIRSCCCKSRCRWKRAEKVCQSMLCAHMGELKGGLT